MRKSSGRVRHMENPHVSLAADAAIAAGTIILPAWAYQLSAWAGFIATMIGLIVVTLRLLIALRDWRNGKIVRDEDVQ